MIYDIEVKQQGSPMAHHIVEAVNALAAINRVESTYGQPVQYPVASIKDEHSHLHRIVVASNWHGYTFEARAIGLYASGKMVNLQPEGSAVSAPSIIPCPQPSLSQKFAAATPPPDKPALLPPLQ
jgi:hypothetical protein